VKQRLVPPVPRLAAALVEAALAQAALMLAALAQAALMLAALADGARLMVARGVVASAAPRLVAPALEQRPTGARTEAETTDVAAGPEVQRASVARQRAPALASHPVKVLAAEGKLALAGLQPRVLLSPQAP